MRKAFTLIELLVIIAIMGLMVTVGIVNVRSGQGAARVRGAARDIYAAIRHARSTALVTMQPSVVTYSCDKVDDEPCAKVEIHSAKMLSSQDGKKGVQTLSGGPMPGAEQNADAQGADVDGATAQGDGGGETIEEVLFAPISTEIVKGMRLKVVVGDEEGRFADESDKKSKVSVFSNVDYLIGRFQSAKAEEKKKTPEKEAPADGAMAADEQQKEVSVAWETNGRTEPHQIWIYPDGSSPEKGLLIKVDRFGGIKVLAGDGSGEEE